MGEWEGPYVGRARLTGTAEPCCVPECDEEAKTTFTAAENGVLAGHEWHVGDELHFCWPHARLVYKGVDPAEPAS